MSRFRRAIWVVLAGFCIGITGIGAGWAGEQGARSIVVNPYEGVDWETVEHHKAALHLHTLQSDGRHPVTEVVAAYREAGFTILSLTDHDWNRPNAAKIGRASCRERVFLTV